MGDVVANVATAHRADETVAGNVADDRSSDAALGLRRSSESQQCCHVERTKALNVSSSWLFDTTGTAVLEEGDNADAMAGRTSVRCDVH